MGSSGKKEYCGGIGFLGSKTGGGTIQALIGATAEKRSACATSHRRLVGRRLEKIDVIISEAAFLNNIKRGAWLQLQEGQKRLFV
jgi:hypothetical protein